MLAMGTRQLEFGSPNPCKSQPATVACASHPNILVLAWGGGHKRMFWKLEDQLAWSI